MNVEIYAKIPLLSDSDNTHPDAMKITRQGETVVFKLDRREVEVSYDHFRRISELFSKE